MSSVGFFFSYVNDARSHEPEDSLYYFSHKISVVVSLWWPWLCEVWYLYTMGVTLFCQAVIHCSPHNTDIPFFVWIIPHSTSPIQITFVGLNIGRMCACYLLVCCRFLHENRDWHFQNPQPDSVLCYYRFKTVELYFILTYTPTCKVMNAVAVQLYVLYAQEHISKIYSRFVC